jgi:peptidyl-dipeptidase A
MWAQLWNTLANQFRPYPDKPSVDVTQAMQKKGWTPKIMFQKAEEFFTSLGLDPMPEVISTHA